MYNKVSNYKMGVGMNKQNDQMKNSHRTRYQSGGMYLIVAVIIVVVVIIGALVYAWQSQSKKTDESASSQTQKVDDKTVSGISVSMLGGKLMMTAVDGWTKGTETNLIKDIDGTSFRVAVQPQGVDFLKLDTIGGYATQVSQVKTTQDTQLYILKLGKNKDKTNLVVSTCAPSNGFGCSPDLDNSKLYVVLAPLGDGSSTIAPLDYSLPATTKAISDFEKIAENLPL